MNFKVKIILRIGTYLHRAIVAQIFKNVKKTQNYRLNKGDTHTETPQILSITTYNLVAQEA